MSVKMNELLAFENFLTEHLHARESDLSHSLIEAVRYSLLSGGKRFRPQVTLAVAKMLDVPFERVVPFAAAVEFIHTYSLIHDDLPCMDDDDFRREKPTNHRVFGEAKALLAGDALLTEAFYLVSNYYLAASDVGLELVRILSDAAGLVGMVAGQVADMKIQAGTNSTSEQELLAMLALKTGVLIRVAVEGAAVVARVPLDERLRLREFGEKLGLAFQLSDDVLDYDPKAAEKSGLPAVIGLESTKAKLIDVSAAAIKCLEKYGARAEALHTLVNLNRLREK